jgi:hypothetical protein
MAKSSRPIERLQTTIDLRAVMNLSSLMFGTLDLPHAEVAENPTTVANGSSAAMPPAWFGERDSTNWR